MKDYKEMAQDVFQRIDAYNNEKAQRKKKIRYTVIPLGIVFAAVIVGVGVWKSSTLQTIISMQPGSNSAIAGASAQEEISGDAHTTTENGMTATSAAKENGSAAKQETNGNDAQTTTEGKTKIYGGANVGDSGSGTGGLFVPALPSDRRIKLTGEALTDAEARTYFDSRRSGIVSELSASGVAADDLKISEKGYSHVNFNGNAEQTLELRQNFRDYLVYNGDRLVAIYTLVKENGKISGTPAFGGPWFDDFNATLNQYKGKELVFVYAGWMELVVTPEGKYFNPMGYELGVDFGSEDIYKMFYHEKAVYVP